MESIIEQIKQEKKEKEKKTFKGTLISIKKAAPNIKIKGLKSKKKQKKCYFNNDKFLSSKF